MIDSFYYFGHIIQYLWMLTIHGVIYFSLNGKSRLYGDFWIFSCQISLELSLCVSRDDRTLVYLWQVMVCRVDLADLVCLYITRRLNTELERIDILAVDLDEYLITRSLSLTKVLWLV